MNDRPARRPARPALALLLAAAVLVVAACAAGGTTAPSPTPSPSPTPGTGTITADEAVARVIASDPQFAGIGPLDPDLIGQSAWVEVSPGTVGWRVMVTKGWGDCQAGCISRHTWIFEVDGDGTVTLVEEQGDPLENGTGEGGAIPPVDVPAEGGPWIVGRALAGPTCPVVQDPPDPACEDRPVEGAVVVVRDPSGTQVAEATSSADGIFLAAVPEGGTYVVEPQPVEGILGTAAPFEVVVPDGPAAWVVADVGYDTGIR
jgi:hypothetical protein